MFPFPSLQLAPLGVQFIGFASGVEDGSSQATVTLPGGTSVGDLVVFYIAIDAPTFGGTSGGSWTTGLANKLYWKKLVDLGSITFTGAGPGTAWLAAVYRGASAVGNVTTTSPTAASGGNLTLTGITRSNGCKGLIACVGTNSGADGASTYAMTSPAGAFRGRQGGTGAAAGTSVGALDFLTPNNYVDAASVVVSGASNSVTYNDIFVAELT